MKILVVAPLMMLLATTQITVQFNENLRLCSLLDVMGENANHCTYLLIVFSYVKGMLNAVEDN